MRQIIRAAPAVVLTVVLTGVLAAGCSAGPAAPHRATVDTCYAFSVRALQRHITVTSVPRACRGLSHAQINQAVGGAIHKVVGPRPKAAARRLASRDSAYLGHLIGSVTPPRPASLATGRAQPASDLGASLAALAAWVLTAAAGSYLLAGWLAPGWSRRRRPSRTAALPPVILLAHFAVAVAGLGIWIAFVVTDTAALAWAAVGLILPAAGLGMAGLAAALPGASPGAWPPGTPPPGPPPASAWPTSAPPPSTRMPVAAVAVHGLLATATILAVVLAAIGAP
jgi:manganese efflux pump family protein